MKAAVFFATREGHTRKVAERIAAALRRHNFDVDVCDVKALRSPIEWPQYRIACIAASIHAGRHEREMIHFVKRYRHELQPLDGFLVSVSLSEAGAEDVAAPDVQRKASAADAQRLIDLFVTDTGWRPRRTLAVAGALAYSQYNILVRFVMKQIARKHRAPTDTSRDYEFTNWCAIDGFVDAFVAAPTLAG
jgi:menaquinone-dependent protoporphyrinogen oxidase